MAYFPHTYVPIGNSNAKKAVYTMPEGGVSLSDRQTVTDSGKCRSISNLDIADGRIRTRKPQFNALEEFFAEGTLNGICREPFCDRLIFHAGTRLYAFDTKQGTVSVLADILPDGKSLICRFMSKLYIYCMTHIYVLDNNLFFTEELEIEAPVIYESVVPGIPGSGKRTQNPFNLVAPKITVTYVDSTAHYFNVPYALDTTRPVELYIDGELCDKELSLSEKGIDMGGIDYSSTRSAKAVYYMKNPAEAGYEDFISGCSIVTSFGGNTNGGTRLFFMGNENFKGKYYKSELQNPLYVSSDESETIGDGNENITAAKKMYGDLMIFTASSVYRMGYDLNQDGIYFTLKEISPQVGCDCPDSVQLVDNRVVFANSRKGIFIIDSVDDTGEHNIKPISSNILKGDGRGLLDNTPESLMNACAVDYDRKYMLFAGTRGYVWDYDSTPYVSSQSYSAAQERLCWYIYDDITGDIFCDAGDSLVSFAEKDGVYIYSMSDSFQSNDTTTVFDSGISECFLPFVRKHMTVFSIKLSRKYESELCLSLYADGKEYYTKKLPERSGGGEKFILKLPLKALYGFGFKLSGVGEYEIEQITAEYIEISE